MKVHWVRFLLTAAGMCVFTAAAIAQQQPAVLHAVVNNVTKAEIRVIRRGDDVFVDTRDLERLGFVGQRWSRALTFSRLITGSRIVAADGEFISLRSLAPYLTFSIDRDIVSIAASMTTAITEISSASRGLFVRGTAPMSPSLKVQSMPVNDLAGPLATITVDIPSATLSGVAPRIEWESGPFESMRASLYCTDDGCGVRLRLEPRVNALWHVVSTPKGFSIVRELSPTAPTEASLTGARAQPGIATISTSLSGSEANSPIAPKASSAFLAATVAQALPAGGTLRGFFSQVKPGTIGSPFAGIGVNSLPVGDLGVDAAAGDILVNIGDTGDTALSSITTTLFRGAGIAVRMADRAALQFFGGRAASASLVRVGVDSAFRPTSHDLLFGSQASWIPNDGPFAAAGGALYTDSPDGGTRTMNVFEAAEYRRSPVLRIRLVTEQSRALDTEATGFGYTVDSRVLTHSFTLDGFFRWLSPRFRPAGGSGLYATLRRSYGLSSTFQRNRLSAGAALSEGKSFSVFDPENVGSLTKSRNGNVSYELSQHLQVQGAYSGSGIITDPDARIPADSDTVQTGGGLALSLGRVHASAQLAHAVTQNRLDPALDFVSQRLDTEVTSSYGNEFYARYSIGHARRRNGQSAGSDYGAAIGMPFIDIHRWTLSTEFGISAAPAGVAQTAFRQAYGTIRINPVANGRSSAGFQITYERVTTAEQKFSAIFASLNAQQVIGWGTGLLAPTYETRALQLTVHQIAMAARTAAIRITVFDDENQNGKFDPGEPPVTPAFVEVAGQTYRTDSHGVATVRVPPGETTVRLLPRGAPIGRFIPSAEVTVNVAAAETGSAFFPLRPAGRLLGKVEPQGEVSLGSISGLVVRADGPVEKLSSVTSAGSFDFGPLPEGEYRVEIVSESLQEHGLAAVAPTEVPARMTRGTRVSVSLKVRKLTARERFGS